VARKRAALFYDALPIIISIIHKGETANSLDSLSEDRCDADHNFQVSAINLLSTIVTSALMFIHIKAV